MTESKRYYYLHMYPIEDIVYENDENLKNGTQMQCKLLV